MHKHKRILLFLILLIGLVGCAQPKIIEFIRMVQIVGYDHYGEKNIRGTAAMPIYAHTGGSGQVQATSDIFSVVVHKGHSLDDALEARSEYPLQLGKLMVILYEDNLARNGIYPYIDFLNRNPDVGRTIHPAIVDGKAEDMIKTRYKSNPLVSVYLSDLLHQETQQSFPKNNLHEFLYSYYGEGMDPFLPLLKRVNNHVEIEGIALFFDDKYVDYLPYSDAFVFKMLFQSFSGGSYSIRWDRNHFITIRNIDSNVDYDVDLNNGGLPIVTIKVKAKGYIRESSAVMTPKNHMDKVQRIMRKSLEKEGEKVIQKLQDVDVDPLRIGDRVRSYDRTWTPERWQDQYPHVTIKLDVKINLAQTGIIE